MRGLYVELRFINGVDYISEDIAHYLRARLTYGRIAIVAEQPKSMMRAIQEHWYITQHGRSPTFNTQSPSEDPQVDVHLSTAKEYKLVPPVCRTLCITCEVSRQDMYMITSWMPSQSLVVIYKLSNALNLN